MNEEKKGHPWERWSGKGHRGFIGILLVLLFLFIIIDMWINSTKPDYHSLQEADSKIKGAHFIHMNQAILKEMADNWLPNDLFWPTVLLDNMPSFQIGELEVMRYNVRVLRDNLSRMRTTDRLDPNAEKAFTFLSHDPYKWWFPSAESRWKKGYEHLQAYYENLLTGKSFFYPRSDNLVELLNQYVSLMGGVNTRLINAPRDMKKALSEDEKEKGSGASEMVDIHISWRQIDDNFYYAQGVAFGLHESFKAIRMDFMEVLKDKNSLIIMDKILEILGRCNFEPLIIFNGDPDSIFANHSLNLSGIFNDARQKINSLIIALMQG